jgi:hypothetical protein
MVTATGVHASVAGQVPSRLCMRAWVQAVRDQFHIICEGHHIPPAITNFHDMKFPKPILDELDGKGIIKPTPIQVGPWRGGRGGTQDSHTLQALRGKWLVACPLPPSYTTVRLGVQLSRQVQ